MHSLLLEAATGEGALRQAPQVLILRIENTYELLGEAFWIDARVAWPDAPCVLTTLLTDEPEVMYQVQAYVVHRHNENEPVASGARSGHYSAYFKHMEEWYQAMRN